MAFQEIFMTLELYLWYSAYKGGTIFLFSNSDILK